MLLGPIKAVVEQIERGRMIVVAKRDRVKKIGNRVKRQHIFKKKDHNR